MLIAVFFSQVPLEASQDKQAGMRAGEKTSGRLAECCFIDLVLGRPGRAESHLRLACSAAERASSCKTLTYYYYYYYHYYHYYYCVISIIVISIIIIMSIIVIIDIVIIVIVIVIIIIIIIIVIIVIISIMKCHYY